MIATSHPLATSAGLALLHEGGNAVDAALAAVAVQCVAEPHMTGIAGDCFALYAPAGANVIALNGSGRAPAAASAADLRSHGMKVIPHECAHAVTIPGAISAWMRLHQDFGSIALDRVFAPAIRYAEEGYAVTARVAYDWAAAANQLARNEGTSAVFLPGGSVPRTGDRHFQPLLGQRLAEIARHGASAFYTGRTAQSLVRRLNSLGGVHTEQDFAEGIDAAHYVDPISTVYRGHEVLECPPNGQGIAALLILEWLAQTQLPAAMDLAERIHLHAEATKHAYALRDAHLADPRFLSETDRRVLVPAGLSPELEHRDTICLAVVDRFGNAISFINSLFQAFGSFILDPETGILLHSRGSSFRLEPGHPNELGPRKRPLHTIIPGMVRRNGRVIMPFGVMGGHYQAAGHAALISGLLDQGLDLQSAIDAPRSFHFGGTLEVEPTVEPTTREQLRGLGHVVSIATKPIGGAQAILIDHERGLLWGGSDPRKDGCALGF